MLCVASVLIAVSGGAALRNSFSLSLSHIYISIKCVYIYIWGPATHIVERERDKYDEEEEVYLLITSSFVGGGCLLIFYTHTTLDSVCSTTRREQSLK